MKVFHDQKAWPSSQSEGVDYRIMSKWDQFSVDSIEKKYQGEMRVPLAEGAGSRKWYKIHSLWISCGEFPFWMRKERVLEEVGIRGEANLIREIEFQITECYLTWVLQELRSPSWWRMKWGCWPSWLQSTKAWTLLTSALVLCWVLLYRSP